MTFEIDAVREKFPALSLTDKGHRRIYLDNPAGTQVPRAVADAVARCLLTTNANLGGFFADRRWRRKQVVDDAHAAMADFLGAASPQEIIIGANMTTLTYHMSRTLGRDDEARRRDHPDPHGSRGQRLALAAVGRGPWPRRALAAFRPAELAGRGGGAQRSC